MEDGGLVLWQKGRGGGKTGKLTQVKSAVCLIQLVWIVLYQPSFLNFGKCAWYMGTLYNLSSISISLDFFKIQIKKKKNLKKSGFLVSLKN